MHHTHTLINSTTQKQKKYCIYKKRILKSKRKKGQKKKLGKIIAMLSSITFLSFFCNYFLYRKTLISKNKMDMIRTVNQKGNTNDSFTAEEVVYFSHDKRVKDPELLL